MPRFARIAIMLAAGMIELHPANAGVISVRTVALANQPAPGTTGDIRFSSFQLPILDRYGRVAFSASLIGTNVATSNDTGYWFENSNGLSLTVREGSLAPGAPANVLFADLINGGDALINNSGTLVLSGEMTGPGITGSNHRGLWWTATGTVTLIARAGTAAPGTGAGVNFGNNFGTLINDSNVLVFGGRLTGSGITPSNDQGVWTNRTGTMTLLARTGNPIVGFPFGQNFGIIAATSLNNAGQIAFQGGVVGGTSNSHFLETNGRFRTIVTGGWHVEPASFMLLLSPSTWPVINDAGHVSTFSGFNAPGQQSTSFFTVLSNANGILLPVAKSLDPAPGAGGIAFGGFFPHALNGAGRVAFKAILNDGNSLTQYGIWSQGFGSLDLVVRGGDPVPGEVEDIDFLEPSTPWLNNMGQTAFTSTLTGTGVDSTNDIGIFVHEAPGVLTMIAREGDSLEVAPADLRTIATLEMLTVGVGVVTRKYAFNDAGQMAFKATFTDGSQAVLVASLGSTINDCNNDAIPDHVQLARNDCNTNQIPDDCDIAWATSVDCNANAVPDSCEPLPIDVLFGGSFESGDFAGWTPSAGVVINNGDTNPPGPSGTFIPYDRFGVMNTAAAPGGLFTLFQDVQFPADATTATLSWIDEIRNYGAQFSNPLQGFRVELRSISNVLLATPFTTQPGEQLIRPPTVRTVDVPVYPGSKVRIIFVVQSAQAHMNVHIDNVKLLVQTTSDCDNDGAFDQCQAAYSDVAGLVDALTNGALNNCLLDADGNGALDGRDIEPFVRRLIS